MLLVRMTLAIVDSCMESEKKVKIVVYLFLFLFRLGLVGCDMAWIGRDGMEWNIGSKVLGSHQSGSVYRTVRTELAGSQGS